MSLSWRGIARSAGTWMPLTLIVFLIAIFLYERGDYPKWERPAVYVFAMICTAYGIVALVQIVRYSLGRYPSFFILIFIYQKGFWEFTMVAAALIALADIDPSIPAPPTKIVLPIFMAAIFARSILDLCLYFGRKYGVLDVEADPVPFRQWMQYRNKPPE